MLSSRGTGKRTWRAGNNNTLPLSGRGNTFGKTGAAVAKAPRARARWRSLQLPCGLTGKPWPAGGVAPEGLGPAGWKSPVLARLRRGGCSGAERDLGFGVGHLHGDEVFSPWGKPGCLWTSGGQRAGVLPAQPWAPRQDPFLGSPCDRCDQVSRSV